MNSLQTPTDTPPTPTDTQARMPALWRRFWARSFDLTWQVTLLGFLFGFGLAKLAPELMVKLLFAVDASNSLLNPWFYAFIPLVPFALLLDSLMLRYLGNTPGKLLLGLKVIHAEQDRPALRTYLYRNLWLWIRGLGLSLPIISQLTMLRQFFQAKEHELTHYDRRTGFRVLARPLPFWRKLLFVVMMFGVYGLNSLPALNQPPPKNLAPLYWKNPETGYKAVLPGYWKTDFRTLPAGNGYLFFGPFSEVLFMSEQVPDLPFEDLVFNFIVATAEKMELGLGAYSDYMGLPMWHTPAPC